MHGGGSVPFRVEEIDDEESTLWCETALHYIKENMTSDLELDAVQERIIAPLQEIANEIGLKGEMKLFGSFMSGFAGKKSDLDVTFIQKDSSQYLQDALTKFASKLESTGKYDSIHLYNLFFESIPKRRIYRHATLRIIGTSQCALPPPSGKIEKNNCQNTLQVVIPTDTPLSCAHKTRG